MTAALLARPPLAAEPLAALPALSRASLIMEPPVVAHSIDWHNLRRTGIGGSDAAAALGLSHWTTPFELWLEKLGEAPPRMDGNDGPLLWGRLLEPLVLSEYERRTGHEVMVPTTMFRSSEHPFMLANLDGLMPGRLYEGKTARTRDGWGEDGSDDIPVVYLLQVQHYMRVMNVPVTDVACLFGGSELGIFTVEADRELQEMLVEGERDMWQRVADRNPPPPISVADARLRWGALGAAGQVIATDKDVLFVESLREAKHLIHELELTVSESERHIMAALGEAGDALVDAEGKPLVTWKLAKGAQRFDAEAFAAEHPGLYADYLRTGKGSRRFLLKTPKGPK